MQHGVTPWIDLGHARTLPRPRSSVNGRPEIDQLLNVCDHVLARRRRSSSAPRLDRALHDPFESVRPPARRDAIGIVRALRVDAWWHVAGRVHDLPAGGDQTLKAPQDGGMVALKGPHGACVLACHQWAPRISNIKPLQPSSQRENL